MCSMMITRTKSKKSTLLNFMSRIIETLLCLDEQCTVKHTMAMCSRILWECIELELSSLDFIALCVCASISCACVCVCKRIFFYLFNRFCIHMCVFFFLVTLLCVYIFTKYWSCTIVCVKRALIIWMVFFVCVFVLFF